MEQYVIKGGTPLRGEVDISGAKNAALALIAAAIMTDETVVIDNLPDVRDINVLLQAIEGIGAVVVRLTRNSIFLEHYLEDSMRLRLHFLVDVILEQDQLISI